MKKVLVLLGLFLEFSALGYAGDESTLVEEENTKENINWPRVIFNTSADNTERNILPGTDVRVEVKLDTSAKGYTWKWEDGSDSVYVFTSKLSEEKNDFEKKTVLLSLIDSVNQTKKDSISFFIWRTPQMQVNSEIHIDDLENPSNKIVKCIRSGNRIQLNRPSVSGGYEDGWTYSWSIGNIALDEANPTVPTQLVENTDSVTTDIKCIIQNKCEKELWLSDTLCSRITLFRRPQLPSQFLKKGNGTTGTWIVKGYEKEMGDLYIATRDGNHIKDLFVVTRDSLQQANDDYWWFCKKGLPEKGLCLYTKRSFPLGKITITSNLLMLSNSNANNFQIWDDSIYPQEVEEPSDENSENPEDVEPGQNDGDEQNPSMSRVATTFTIYGGRANQLQRGLNIVRFEDGSVRKVIIK